MYIIMIKLLDEKFHFFRALAISFVCQHPESLKVRNVWWCVCVCVVHIVRLLMPKRLTKVVRDCWDRVTCWNKNRLFG